MENTESTIFTQLEKVSLKVNIKENAPKSDLEFMRLLQEGEETNDIDKIYQFVEAYERERGLIRDEMIHKMIAEAYNENPKFLMMVLAKKHFSNNAFIFLSVNNI